MRSTDQMIAISRAFSDTQDSPCHLLLNKVIDPDHFPVGTRVGTAAGQEYQGASNPEHVFRFGLDRILDGIAELIRMKNSK